MAPPSLTPRHFEEALIDMGAAVPRKSGPTSSNKDNTVDADLRLQALRDMSGPQVALVLAARRILHRDSGKTNKKRNDEIGAEQLHLTLHRMLHEYQAFYKGNPRYSSRLLRHALSDLLETGLFRPALDHTGMGPLQYQWHDHHHHQHGDNDVDAMDHMALHLTVDIHREVKKALDNDSSVFHCSTALREWGKNTN